MKKTSAVISICLFFVMLIIVSVSYAAEAVKPQEGLGGSQRIIQPIKPSRGVITRQGGNCAPLQFVSTSPLPTAVVGGDYSFQFQASGGVPPYKFCSLGPNVKNLPFTTSQACNSLVAGDIPLNSSGLMKGQINCNGPYACTIFPQCGGAKCAGYRSFGVKVTDSCPSGAKSIVKEFWIQINEHP